MNYNSITNNPAAKFVLYGVAIAAFLLVTAKLVLVTAIVLQFIVLIVVALYLSKRFDTMWADLDEDLHATVDELRKEVSSMREEMREQRQAPIPAPAPAPDVAVHSWATRPAGARQQPGPTPVSAIFREWE